MSEDEQQDWASFDRPMFREDTATPLRKYCEYAIKRGYVENILHKPVVPSALRDLWDEAYELGRADVLKGSKECFVPVDHQTSAFRWPPCQSEDAAKRRMTPRYTEIMPVRLVFFPRSG